MTKTKKVSSTAVIKAAEAQLRRRLIAVGTERDKLREIASEYDSLADSCDEAYEALQSAVGALSRYA